MKTFVWNRLMYWIFCCRICVKLTKKTIKWLSFIIYSEHFAISLQLYKRITPQEVFFQKFSNIFKTPTHKNTFRCFCMEHPCVKYDSIQESLSLVICTINNVKQISGNSPILTRNYFNTWLGPLLDYRVTFSQIYHS